MIRPVPILILILLQQQPRTLLLRRTVRIACSGGRRNGRRLSWCREKGFRLCSLCRSPQSRFFQGRRSRGIGFLGSRSGPFRRSRVGGAIAAIVYGTICRCRFLSLGRRYGTVVIVRTGIWLFALHFSENAANPRKVKEDGKVKIQITIQTVRLSNPIQERKENSRSRDARGICWECSIMPSFSLVFFRVRNAELITKRPNGFSGPATTSERRLEETKSLILQISVRIAIWKKTDSISGRSLRSGRIVCCPHVAEVPDLELSH